MSNHCAYLDVLGSVAFSPVKNDMLGNVKVCIKLQLHPESGWSIGCMFSS